jgi:hypothetical protein
MPVTSAPANGDEQSYAFAINSEPVLTAYSTADGIGGIDNKKIIIEDAAESNIFNSDLINGSG